MNKTHFTRQRFGFTIIELIVVVIIIGVLAAVAIPSYRIQILKMKNQEGIRILMAVWEGQKEYYQDNGVYTDQTGGIDVTIPTSKHFWPPSLKNSPTATVYCNGADQRYLAKLRTQTAEYNLYVLEDGRIVCSAGVNCSDSICKKMGFPDSW